MGKFLITGGMIFRAGVLGLSVLVIMTLPAMVSGQAGPQDIIEEPAIQVQESSEETFHYQGGNRRDPFKSLLVLQEKKRDVSMLPPIQQADLKSFTVVGLISDDKYGNRAMVRGPDGKTYIVKKGDIIGKNEGKVVSIDLEGVSVLETFLDFMNRETVLTTVLKVEEKQR